MEVGVNGQITASATRLVARGKDINIVLAPIHPPQKTERTVEEKRGRERNVKWLRAKVKWTSLHPLHPNIIIHNLYTILFTRRNGSTIKNFTSS